MAVDAAVAGAESVPKGVGKGLTHKIGPLPVWGWIAVLVVGGAAAWFAYNAYQQAQGGGSVTPSFLTGTPFTGGSGTPDMSTTTATTTATLTNAQWVNNIASQVAAATGESLSQVNLYLNSYLAGAQITGNSDAVSAFNNVINTALQVGGSPPGGTPQLNVNTNAFSSEQTYLNDLLTYLPSGTSQDVINEITNLLNGSTTVISQGAANALSSAQSVVGVGPNSVTYTIAGAISQAQVQALAAIAGASGTAIGGAAPTDATANFNAWSASVKSSIPSLSNASTNDLAYIYNYINQSFGPGGSQQFRVAGTSNLNTAALASWLNTIIPQLGSLPATTAITTYTGSGIITGAVPGQSVATTPARSV